MKMSEGDFIDYLEVLDSAEHVILKETLNERIEETKVFYSPIPNSMLVMVEIYKPRLSANKKKLHFEMEDTQYFIENEIGEREIVEVDMFDF